MPPSLVGCRSPDPPALGRPPISEVGDRFGHPEGVQVKLNDSLAILNSRFYPPGRGRNPHTSGPRGPESGPRALGKLVVGRADEMVPRTGRPRWVIALPPMHR